MSEKVLQSQIHLDPLSKFIKAFNPEQYSSIGSSLNEVETDLIAYCQVTLVYCVMFYCP